MYDVVVIGADPSGCVVAKVLAEKGHKVLLVERCKMPRYKSCSGILIKKSIELVECYFGVSVPSSVMCSPTENKVMIFIEIKENSISLSKKVRMFGEVYLITGLQSKQQIVA